MSELISHGKTRRYAPDVTFAPQRPTVTRAEVRYCVIGVMYNDKTAWQVLAVKEKIVVLSTLYEAQGVLPWLGTGRPYVWDATREVLTFTLLDPRPDGFNRLCILTKYDPYNVPARMIPGLRSEAHARDWHSHVLWTNVKAELQAWSEDQSRRRQKASEGSYLLAIR